MAQLINFYAEPDYRNDELEQQLFARLLEEAERRNVSVVTLEKGEVGRGGNRNFVLYKRSL